MYAGAKIGSKLGPISEWRSPDDVVAWLRENILTGTTTWLAQMEAANQWAVAVSRDPEWMLTKVDADIIIEFVRLGQSESDRAKLEDQVEYLMKTLDRRATSAHSLYGSVERTNKAATSKRKLSTTMMQAANRYVYLARRWPR